MTNTVPVLPSYVRDGWWTPADASTPGGTATDAPEAARAVVVHDASTGEPVARLSTDGLDMAAVLDHARDVGQKSLGDLTIHERAVLLKRMALELTAHKDELYEVSARTGATARDSAFDVDGGIGVLFTYSSKGRRELPNANLILDGPPEQLSKDGSFLGRHVYTRLSGVAVQINAFNFPVWGPLEKFAPAFLAGVPTVIKPATPTAYLTEAWVRVLVEAGLVPDGSLQLVSGPARDLLGHLRLGDSVAFTGSADTARRLRGSVAEGVRFTAEADSINASVLGPDGVPGSAEFDAYVRQLVTEMTVKAGQKCTAIRRAIVPEALVDDVVAAVGTRLAQKVTVGDPRAEGVTMGPLASLEQREELHRQVEKLIGAGGRVAVGPADFAAPPEVVRADGTVGAAPGGAFAAPLLLRFDDADAAALHDVEAFGPVASVVGYRDVGHAADLVVRGGGSLVTSVATSDPAAAAALFGRLCAANGRVLFLDRDDARTSTGHGSPVPHLVHGGPGRAGGGEELGGVRAVHHYMQRTAIQGSPRMLTELTGVWHTGAPAGGAGAVHPFRKSLAELRVGDQVVAGPREVTLEDIEHFAEFTGDTFYAHMDETAAAANPFFPGRVAHGYLLVSFAAGLFVDPDPGPVLANYGLENLRFRTPVSPGEAITVTLTAKQIIPRETDDHGEVRWDAVLRNQDYEVVATYDVLTLVAKEWPPPE
ncbi:phenylacetic acid degradation bifunctional protein PaaZ [Myceligenerans pegani]|uniref:Phenylacetic acid degradation bifunctional protein PaaZ n=1 Tax=Myceligenerans pegani TaxID=2776917 RepID=A0ABR9N1I1_9MICO|nr:phenylacetic acid degradation bifunctional protein PaaZ [Myceligenerans sp. TRM 65318]MBE1876938.1 phenylacetic acid degradation bifunctional protein PaaZ [Myceligenerans sp. TRM 65318]MBE3019209.1 phenylacetic acid degradation bifunctional protein PaaZ [Myceligenerans sp. TRM 65318]